jgi:AcrR family transcriptional regulator
MATVGVEWKAKPESAQYEDTRKQLIDAAEAIMREKGITAVRLDAVASVVGLHRSSVYRYFNTKEELITAVVVKATLRLGEAITDKIGRDAEPARLLVDGIVAALRAMRSDELFQSLHAPAASEAVNRISTAAVAEGIKPLLQPMLDAAAERGGLREGVSPDDALRWLMVVTSGVIGSPHLVRDDEDFRDLLNRMLVPALFP